MSCDSYVRVQVNFTRINKMEVFNFYVYVRPFDTLSLVRTQGSYATVKIHSKRSSSAGMKIKTAGYLLETLSF